MTEQHDEPKDESNEAPDDTAAHEAQAHGPEVTERPPPGVHETGGTDRGTTPAPAFDDVIETGAVGAEAEGEAEAENDGGESEAEGEAEKDEAERGAENDDDEPAREIEDDGEAPDELHADDADEPHANGTHVDTETTVDLSGEAFANLPLRDDATRASEDRTALTRGHLKGLLEALVFASDKPIKPNELAKSASAQAKEVKELLGELKTEYASRGIQLDEVAGGWIFRTNAQYAPFVRDLTKQKPVRLSRAQIETLAILAYRQPITRPEIDDIRGVDCGAVLKLLLERDLIKILGKKDEPGRPLLYGTTPQFLEFFGLKSLKDLPTLKEFTELNDESRATVERELGEVLEARQPMSTDPAIGSPEASTPPLPPEAYEDAPEDGPRTDPPSDHAEPDTESKIEAVPEVAADRAEATDEEAEASEEVPSEHAAAESDAENAALPHDTLPPPARKPGAWEMAADGEEEEEEEEEEDDVDEDDEDEDEENESDEG